MLTVFINDERIILHFCFFYFSTFLPLPAFCMECIPYKFCDLKILFDPPNPPQHIVLYTGCVWSALLVPGPLGGLPSSNEQMGHSSSKLFTYGSKCHKWPRRRAER